MSSVGFMEKLLDGVAVEWKALGAVTNVLRGRRLTKSQLSEGEKIPVFHGGLEPLGHYANANRPANTVMIINVGASAGTVGYSAVDFWSSDGCFCLEHNELINNRFLYFALIGHQNLLRSKVRVAGIPTLDAIVVERLEIPIPCPENPKKSLEIQAEIVRILDAFTAHTAELTNELTARRKQYNYYRDQLLSFEEGEVEWKTLGEMCVIGDGNHSSKYPRSDEMVEQGVPFIRGTNMVGGTISSLDMKFITEEKHQELKKGHLKAYDVLIANRGEIGKIAQVPKHFSGANLNSQLAWLRAKQEILLPSFLFYVLNTSHVQSTISGEGGALQQLTIKNIKLIRIPVPSLQEQARIVAILDKFYALTHSISEGLPREIALRRKQYEYYRDLLLSFPKLEVVV